MKTRIPTHRKILAFFLSLLFLMSAAGTPLSVLGAEIAEWVTQSTSEDKAPPSSTDLEEIRVPEVTANPYPLENNSFILPVYTSYFYEQNKKGWGLFNSYGQYTSRTEDRSQYYTGSVLVLTDRSSSDYRGIQFTSDLPYTEERSLMFHPELTAKAEGRSTASVSTAFKAEHLAQLVPEGDSIWNYLDPSQTHMTVAGKLLLGHGSLNATLYQRGQGGNQTTKFEDIFYTENEGNSYKTRYLGVDGEPATYPLTATFPLTKDFDEVFINFRTWSGGAITDFQAVLLDDGQPYTKNIRFEMETGLRDDEADLVLIAEMNEGIRYRGDENLEELHANTYLRVSLWNETAGRTEYVNMFLDKVDGSNQLVFRGNIGKLHYCNFRVDDILWANAPTKKSYRQVGGVLDLADGMVLAAGKVMEYGNSVQSARLGTTSYTPRGLLCDHAGNELSLNNLVNWNSGYLRKFVFRPNSIAADEIYVYSDHTLGVAEGEIDASTAAPEHMFVGPGRDLTVHIQLSREVDEEIWKQLYITLNILDKDGKALKVYPTSATRTFNDEVYADGTKIGTLLKFENIPLSSDMSLDAAPGGEPLVWVTGFGSDYDPNTTGLPPVYPGLDAPENTLYADLTPPAVTVRKISETTIETETPAKYYQVSMEIGVEDPTAFARSAGILGQSAFITLSGGVETETSIRYLLSTDPRAPTDPAAYVKEAVLAPNAWVTIGNHTLLNNPSVVYVHILTQSKQLYVNGLTLHVGVSDLAMNQTTSQPDGKLEYVIDELAPRVSILTKRAAAEDNNTTIRLSVDVQAADHSKVHQILYHFGRENLAEDAEWQVAVVDQFGELVSATIEKKYGDPNGGDANTAYAETLWIKAVDEYGNESQPVSTYVRLSLQKPATAVRYNGNPLAVSAAHQILVSGPEASAFDDRTAYTRVTLTPLGDSEYAYVTVIPTGQTNVDVLALENLTWYRVKIGTNAYEEVSDPVTVAQNTDGILTELITYYGDLKVSFENGYGDTENGKAMIPKLGALSAEAADGSYFADPDYYVVRYASPLLEDRLVHHVDFGIIEDLSILNQSTDPNVSATIVADSDQGADPYLLNQPYKGISALRNLQFHFTIRNAANDSYGLADFDYDQSTVSLIKQGEGGGADTVICTAKLWATDDQYFSPGGFDLPPEALTSGAYYVQVTVVSRSGHTDSYESSRIVLDAQNADQAGLWSYTYETKADIADTTSGRLVAIIKDGTVDNNNQAFEDIGIAVFPGGETDRNRFLATYSFGVESLEVHLSVPGSVKTYEGITIGEVEGYKMWNSLNNPTAAEIEARPFERTPTADAYNAPLTDELIRSTGTGAIYSADTIPQGIVGFSKLYLVKGTNTICYQVKLKNGYISPIRQFTITVTDEAPALSISVEGYQPSLTPSAVQGVVNADHVRYMLDAAYSINGTGNVQVDLWSTYAMNMGLLDQNNNPVDTLVGAQSLDLQVIHRGMKPEEYADFTENSYTAIFPMDSMSECTGVFVATDEYGGVTVVAPQLGDIERAQTPGDTVGEKEIRIAYVGDYFSDPYCVDDSIFRYRIYYNQPVYFGAQILALETYMVENTPEGEVRVKDIQTNTPDLAYNQFSMRQNDILLSDETSVDLGGSHLVYYDDNGSDTNNFKHILLSDVRVTLNGDITGNQPVTVDFLSGKVIDENGVMTDTLNTIGYMYGTTKYDTVDSDNELRFYVANPPADTDTHLAGSTTTLNYTLRYGHMYGDTYEKTGTMTLTYIDYTVSATMTEHGADLTPTFAVRDDTNAGLTRTGRFQAGNYKATLPDYFGNAKEYDYTVSTQTDTQTTITYQKHTHTAQPVTVTLTRADTTPITVDVTDYGIMNVQGNGSTAVTVTVTENTRFSYRYMDSESTEKMFYISVDNIFSPDPRAVFNFDLEADCLKAEDGTKYRYGPVTVFLADNNFRLIDKYTGETPSFTFTPGGERAHVFKADEIVAMLGDEEVELENDITVVLNVALYEVPEVDFTVGEDTGSPNVQVRAYSKLGEAYSDQKLSMQLHAARNSSVLTTHEGHTVISYVGNRANMSEVLSRLGWSTAYRFLLEVVDTSRVRLFVKEGIYADAPDFQTGVSDEMDGVTLNSRILTVTKNAAFTLFVVDRFNNYSSIAFDVTDIGHAPLPEVVKIPLSHDKVRVYLLPPADATDFTISQAHNPQTDDDLESQYVHQQYVEISTNDDYSIMYSMTYNGTPITNETIKVSVSEIHVEEMALKELTWSDNKAQEATAKPITADAVFSYDVTEIQAVTEFDGSKVSFATAGNTLKVTYTENHPAMTLYAYAANGTRTTVQLDAVENIDRTGPVVTVKDETLAPNGRSLTLVLRVNERATFKQGYGRYGDAVTDSDGATYYEHTILITENGAHTFTFTDLSGIMTEFTYETDKLVLSDLTALYNTAPADAGAAEDPAGLALKAGDKVYVKPSRKATATLSGLQTPIDMPAGEWYELTIPETAAGIPPYIILEDEYGNTLTHQFAEVVIPDTYAPEITINKKTYAVPVGTDRAAIEAELMNNFLAFDDRDATVTLAVEFTEDLSVEGLTDVVYTATDSAGNTAKAYGKLRITSIYEPVVHIGETRVLREEGIALRSGENVTLQIQTQGVAYKVIVANGKRTAAQMKGLEAAAAYSKAETADLGVLRDGLYTVLIVTEQRDYFRILLSVERF